MKGRDILVATEPVAGAFEKLGVLYYIGGSVASSAYGIARSAMDVDMASDLEPEHVQPFVKMLESSYYTDEDMVLDAIRNCSSFNLDGPVKSRKCFKSVIPAGIQAHYPDLLRSYRNSS